MFRYLLGVFLLAPNALAFEVESSLLNRAMGTDSVRANTVSVPEQRQSTSPPFRSVLTLRHRFWVPYSTPNRTRFFVGIFWSVFWGGTARNRQVQTVQRPEQVNPS